MKKLTHGESGFTLIEMLIVLFIIGALLLIILPQVTQAGVKAQQKACDANKQLIQAQVDSYYLENQHKYPESIDDLLDNYLKENPVCPLAIADDESTKSHSYTIDPSTGEVKCKHHDINDADTGEKENESPDQSV